MEKFTTGNLDVVDRLNRLIDAVDSLERMTGDEFIQVRRASGGISISLDRSRLGPIKFTVKIFEVQDRDGITGDGLYNCYEQTLLSEEWADVTGADRFDNVDTTGVVVFNLEESDCLADYEDCALVEKDLIKAWPMTDDGGTVRWVGKPLHSGVRLAKTTEAAQNDDNITVDIYRRDGTVSTGLGAGVDAYGLANTGTADFDDSLPRWATAKDLYVKNEQGKWYVVTTIQQSEDCACS